jgi:antitoxin (DNA-binding transcriptional repressor) of toxin-antitoxin stability system
MALEFVMVSKSFDVRDPQVTIQTLLSQLRNGLEIVLVEGGKPIARLVLVEEEDKPKEKRTPGLQPGSIWTSQDFDAPLPDLGS